MEIFSIIKDVIISIAAATTAFVAYKGLERWQHELRGKANFDTARKLIRATYKLRDEISYARSPFIPASEFPEDYDPSNKSSKNKGDAFAHVYGRRWERIVEAIQDYDAFALEAEALWGANIKEKTDELRDCVIDLRSAIDGYISNEYSGGEDFKDRQYAVSVRSKFLTAVKTITNYQKVSNGQLRA